MKMKLDFDLDDKEDFPIIIGDDECINPNWTLHKFKQICRAIDKINNRIEYLIRIDGLLREKIDKLEIKNKE